MGVPESSCAASSKARSRRPSCNALSLFQRLNPRFTDLAGCVEALRPDLETLADTARRTRPDKANLFATVEYDRIAWERVQQGVDRWARR